MKLIPRILLAGLLMPLASAAAQDPLDPFSGFGNDPVMFRTAWSMDGARPGDQLVLAVVADIDDGWHINPDAARLSDDALIETAITVVDQSSSVQLQGAIFPEPHFVQFAGDTVLSYESTLR